MFISQGIKMRFAVVFTLILVSLHNVSGGVAGGGGGDVGGVRGATGTAAREKETLHAAAQQRIEQAQDEIWTREDLARLLTFNSNRRRPSCRTTRRMADKKTAVCSEDPVDIFRTCMSKATVGRQTNPYRYAYYPKIPSDRIRRRLQHKMEANEDFTPFENNLLKRIKLHMDAKMRYQRCRGCKPSMDDDDKDDPFELVSLERAIPLFYGIEVLWDCPALLALEEAFLSYVSFFGDTDDFQLECFAITSQLSSPNGNPVNFPEPFAVAEEVLRKDKGVTAATVVFTYKVRRSFLLEGPFGDVEEEEEEVVAGGDGEGSDSDENDSDDEESDRLLRRRHGSEAHRALRSGPSCTTEDQILCCSQSIVNGDPGVFCAQIGCDFSLCARRRRLMSSPEEEGEATTSSLLRHRNLAKNKRNGFYIHLPNGEWLLEMEDDSQDVSDDGEQEDEDEEPLAAPTRNKIPFVNPDCGSSSSDITSFISCCNAGVFGDALEGVELLVGEVPEIVRDVAICGYNNAVVNGDLFLPNGTDLVAESPSTLTCTEFETAGCDSVLDATDFDEVSEQDICFAGERPDDDTSEPSSSPLSPPTSFPSQGPSSYPSEMPSSHPTCQANVVIDFETDAAGNPLPLGAVIDKTLRFAGGATVEARRRQDGPRGPFNAGMIFNATMATGNDLDLEFPERRNILIITENFDSSNPDDNFRGGLIRVTFDTPVRVEEVSFLDVDNAMRETRVDFFADGDFQRRNPIETVMIPVMGDGVAQMVKFGVDGVKSFVVTMGGSGAVDDIFLRVDCDEAAP